MSVWESALLNEDEEEEETVWWCVVSPLWSKLSCRFWRLWQNQSELLCTYWKVLSGLMQIDSEWAMFLSVEKSCADIIGNLDNFYCRVIIPSQICLKCTNCIYCGAGFSKISPYRTCRSAMEGQWFQSQFDRCLWLQPNWSGYAKMPTHKDWWNCYCSFSETYCLFRIENLTPWFGKNVVPLGFAS